MPDDYTPTTGEVRRRYAYARTDKPSHKNQSAVAEFDRWLIDMLAAHDAEKRAEWETERGETEWEYGAQHSQGTNPHPSRKQAEEMVAWHAAGDARKQLIARGKSKLVRRRKAGPWLPVPDTTNHESEDRA